MNGATTYQAVDRLASLLIVKQYIAPESKTDEIKPVGRSIESNGSGELWDIVQGKDIDKVMSIIQEHFDAVRLVYPKEYDMVFQKLRDI